MPRGVHLEKFRSLCKIQGIVLRLYSFRGVGVVVVTKRCFKLVAQGSEFVKTGSVVVDCFDTPTQTSSSCQYSSLRLLPPTDEPLIESSIL